MFIFAVLSSIERSDFYCCCLTLTFCSCWDEFSTIIFLMYKWRWSFLMKLSPVWITVQSLVASWNQTLSNTTSQWSGESDTPRCVKKLISHKAQTKQSRCGIHTRVTSHKFDPKLRLFKLTSKTRAELEIDPTPETMLRSEKQSAGEVIKIWTHERIIQLPGLLQRRLKFMVCVCSHVWRFRPLASGSGTYCDTSIDGIGTCWPRSSAGQLVSRPCPEMFYGVRYNTTSKSSPSAPNNNPPPTAVSFPSREKAAWEISIQISKRF